MGLIIDGVSARDLILDGSPVSLYAGGNPPVKVWPTRETVQITLGTGFEARDQLRAALSARGLVYHKVTEIPFDIKLVGTGSAREMFYNCLALTTVPDLDTSGVTSMYAMFHSCSSLTSVPAMDTSNVTTMYAMLQKCSALTSVPAMDTSQVTDMQHMFRNSPALTSVPPMDTSNVTNMYAMFYDCPALTSVPDLDTNNVTNMDWMLSSCSALTDGNVRLIGRHPQVTTTSMIAGSGLTRPPFYDTDGNPAPRKVTIERDPYVAGFKQPATGDVSLIDDWIGISGEIGAFFVAPVTCNRDLRNADTYGAIRAGATIPTGQGVYPTYSQGTPYVFTEVL